MKERGLPERTLLWEPSDPAGKIFFPLSGLISIRMSTGDRHLIEVATIGREAAAGVQEGVGLLPVLTQAVVQVPGLFMTISTDAFTACTHENEEIRRAARLCKAWRLLQSQQIGACNSVHEVEARFCRWLLRASDALDEETVP
jgi:CRP-like cAMP-binding protein